MTHTTRRLLQDGLVIALIILVLAVLATGMELILWEALV